MRRFLRELSIWGSLALVLGVVGLVAWATHHPHHELVRRAEAWPAVGPWVERFRVAYSGVGQAPPAEEEVGERGAEVEAVGVPDGVPPAAAGGPEADGPPLPGPPRAAAPGVGAGAGPPLGSAARPVLPLPGRPPESEHLEAAKALLGVERPAGRLGPYDLYTDAAHRGAWAHLDRLAAEVEGVYRRRYGRPPLGESREAVVLFAEESDYRRFQAREERLGGLPAGGHAGAGMVSLYLGGRRREEVAATLVHELGHLLNRRAVGPALPPWLDEGIADDLASSRVGPAGDLRPAELGGAVVVSGERVDYHGALASLRQLDAAFAAGAQPRIERLVALDWESFVRSEDRPLHYAMAGFFVRYLIEGEGGALAPAFRRFLAGVAAGGDVAGEALRRETGRSWSVLERGLREWVHAEVGRTTLAPPTRR